MRFFFDRNIGINLARMLNAFEGDRHTVRHQDDDTRFIDTTTDVDIINTLAADITDSPKWVYVTADLAQRRVAEERKALAASGMTVFFFRKGFHDLSFHMQAVKVIWIWPFMIEAANTARIPTAFEISPRVSAEKVERLCATSDLIRL